MALLKWVPLLGFVVATGGCTIDAFACSDASQCDWLGGAAVCLADGICAYADDDCPSGLRRSPNAATDPSRCVEDTGSSTATPGSSSTGSSTGLGTSTSEASGSAETCAPLDWFPDADGDGFGDANAAPVTACEAPAGTVDNAQDCNDQDPRVRPDHLQCDDNPGLVAWYRLDESADAGFAVDESQGSIGSLEGAPTFGVEGVYGTAVRYVEHPDRIAIAETVGQFAPGGTPASEGTIEFWALPDPLDEACAADCAGFIIHISDETGDGFGSNTSDLHIHIDHSSEGMPYRWRAFIDGAFAGGENCNLTGPEVEFDRWTHVALRWTAESCGLVVDGISEPESGGISPSPQWLEGRIGHPPSRPDRAYQGAIDEVMLFDRSRSNAELRRDCGRAQCPPP